MVKVSILATLNRLVVEIDYDTSIFVDITSWLKKRVIDTLLQECKIEGIAGGYWLEVDMPEENLELLKLIHRSDLRSRTLRNVFCSFLLNEISKQELERLLRLYDMSKTIGRE
jgi:hypothetical protein